MRYVFCSLLALTLWTPQAFADQAAEDAAAELLVERMRTQRPEDLAILEAAAGKDIVVVRGSMDHIETVLAAARIPHTVINPAQVAQADLMADQIVMVNCPGNMPTAGVKRIEKFVRAGGLLYTTDWALKNLVQRAFPKTIRHNGKGTGDHVTHVHVAKADDNIMTNMLLRNDSKPQWWLEGGSYPVKVLDSERVQVLASSKQMKKLYGAAPVVVRFPWHDGHVIHVVSHFYRQAATTGPTVAAKNKVEEFNGLTASQKQKFKSGKAGNVSLSEVESSYAFQQMTSNIVVGKSRDNETLDKEYGYENRSAVTLEGRAVPVGSRLKVLKRKKNRVQVRDDRGNEAWVDETALMAR